MNEALDRLSCFDTEDGLKRLGGSREFMVELLYHFILEFSAAADEYERLMEEGKRDPAIRLIHSVKGAAGNLGAKQLQASASALEEDLKRKDLAGAERLFVLFAGDLKEALEDIRRSGIEDLWGGRGKSPGDEALLMGLLSQFKAYAEAGQMKSARKIVRDLELYHWPDEAGRTVDAIRSLMKCYKIKDAAQAADQLLEELVGDVI